MAMAREAWPNALNAQLVNSQRGGGYFRGVYLLPKIRWGFFSGSFFRNHGFFCGGLQLFLNLGSPRCRSTPNGPLIWRFCVRTSPFDQTIFPTLFSNQTILDSIHFGSHLDDLIRSFCSCCSEKEAWTGMS